MLALGPFEEKKGVYALGAEGRGGGVQGGAALRA
jgi:hypothetical protein